MSPLRHIDLSMIMTLLIVVGALLFLMISYKATNAEESVTIPDGTETAIFAGGCFWCTEAAFDTQDGVYEAVSGFSGGSEDDPDYRDVAYGKTSHREAIQVLYDPSKVGYDKLLEIFWLSIDPFDEGGQFYDRGTQYTTAIFYGNDEEKQKAEASKAAIEAKHGKTVATEILPAGEFHPADQSHQNYYEKNPVHYNAYKYGSGRVKKLKEIWGKE